MKTIVRDIIIKREDYIHSTATLQDVVNKMAKNDTHHMILIKDEEVVGIITERDILHLYHDQVDFEISAIEFATLSVISMSHKRPLGYALSLMIDHGIRRIVTLDENQKYVGSVVQEELIFAYEQELFKGHIKVNELIDIKNKIVSISSDSTLADALDIMAEKNIGSILISENSIAIGILTESDTLRLAQKHVSTDENVKKFMHSPILEIKWDAYIFEVIDFMRKNSIRHVLTHNELNEYYIISSKDILKNIKGNYSTFLESKLRDTRDTFNQINEAVIELTDLGDDQVISWLNKTAKNLLTVKVDSSIREIIPQDRWELIYKELKQDTKLKSQTISIENKDFKFNVSINNILGIDIIKILMTDITELTVLNKELSHQIDEVKKVAINKEKLFIEAFNQAAVGIFHVSKENKIIDSNTHASKLLGYSVDELVGKNIYDITYPDEREITKKSYEKLWIDKTIDNFSIDKRCIKKDGSVIWINVTTSLSLDLEHDEQYSICVLIDISEKKHLLNELTKSNELFEAVYNQAAVGIAIILPENVFLQTNQKFCDIVGYTEDELRNRTVFDIIDKEYLKKSRENLQNINTKKISNFSMEKRFIKKDGTVFWGNVTVSTLLDTENKVKFNIAILEDIQKRKDAQKEAAFQYQTLRSVLDSTDDMIYYKDYLHSDGNYLGANKSLAKLLNTQQSNIVGRNDVEIFGEEFGLKYQRDDKSVLKNLSSKTIEEWVTDTQNNKLLFSTQKTPFYNEENELVGILGIGRDITKLHEQQIEILEQKELMMVQSRHAAMGEMIGMIAHQWRQPISVIAMSANNMLLDLSFDEINIDDFEKAASSILDQTQHLSKTIDDFRNFFRPDNEKETVMLKSIIQESIGIFGASLKNSNIQLVLDIQSESFIHIHGRELLQVYINLIKNAQDALIEHRKENRTITITISENNKYIDTIICDNGGGIPKDLINEIFDPYFTTKDKKIGTGVGLHMSKTIIEQHMNGLLTVQNNNGGACFTVQLPKQENH